MSTARRVATRLCCIGIAASPVSSICAVLRSAGHGSPRSTPGVYPAITVVDDTQIFGNFNCRSSLGFPSAAGRLGNAQNLLLPVVQGHSVGDQGFLQASQAGRDRPKLGSNRRARGNDVSNLGGVRPNLGRRRPILGCLRPTPAGELQGRGRGSAKFQPDSANFGHLFCEALSSISRSQSAHAIARMRFR